MTSTTEITARTNTPQGVALAGRTVSSWDRITEIRATRADDGVLVEMGSPQGNALQGPAMLLRPAEAVHFAVLLIRAAGEDLTGINLSDPKVRTMYWSGFSPDEIREAVKNANGSARGGEKPKTAIGDDTEVAAHLRLQCLSLVVGARLGDYVNLAREFFEFVNGSKVEAPPTATQAAQDQPDAR